MRKCNTRAENGLKEMKELLKIVTTKEIPTTKNHPLTFILSELIKTKENLMTIIMNFKI